MLQESSQDISILFPTPAFTTFILGAIGDRMGLSTSGHVVMSKLKTSQARLFFAVKGNVAVIGPVYL